jgi:hypothetical protein
MMVAHEHPKFIKKKKSEQTNAKFSFLNYMSQSYKHETK